MNRSVYEAEAHLTQLYAQHFGPLDAPPGIAAPVLASAPGRVELAGNHTDHQGGHTLSAAISERAWALAQDNNSQEICVFMDGFGSLSLSCSDLDPRAGEHETSLALVRGMAAAWARSGHELRGFNMVTCSDIPVGSGVSSSAAFEVLIGTVLRALDNTGGPYPTAAMSTPSDLTTLALEGAWAEQNYFGKPCGAQDQLASAHGGVVALDFSHDVPRVASVPFDASGYTLCLIDSRCDHSRYTDEFAAIPADMFAVAHSFACDKLGEVPAASFFAKMSTLRVQFGDRAVLRALHFFEEDARVQAQQQALEAHDFGSFLAYVRRSGSSSAQYLQNVSPHADAERAHQPAMVILALCAHLLDGTPPRRYAWRIHGGGFGGSVLAFIPNQDAASFMTSMDDLLGYDACMALAISAEGAQAKTLAPSSS